ncbi:MAG: Gfo/Idh/MocA family oxidoreductase [Verrucomicrobiota bacterium JB024]|nr:Gfo/Idh/MocA family oxidoreductase [Verrucomicrobiota bacterium JB024]
MNHTQTPVSTALVGISGYGRLYYDAMLRLREAGKIRLEAATVINQEQEKERCAHLRALGCRIYDNYDRMLEAERSHLRLCCLPTGINWHKSMTVAALEAGLNVLVEKPAAATLADIAQMCEARDRAGRQAFVGFQHMYVPALRAVKQRVLRGELGKVTRLRVHVQWPRALSYYARTGWAGRLFYHDEPVLDSPANNAMAHFILMALYWAGTTEDEFADIEDMQVQLYQAQTIESFDTFSARVRTSDAKELIFNMSHSSERMSPAQVMIDGTEGSIRWNEASGLSHRVLGGEWLLSADDVPKDNRKFMFENVLERLHGGTTPICTLEMAAQHTAFIERVHASAEITPVPEAWIRQRMVGTEEFRFVSGLTEQLKLADEQGLLLSEVSPAWQEQLKSGVVPL